MPDVTAPHPPACRIVPPWLVQRLTAHPSGHVAECARRTLRSDQAFRAAPRAPARPVPRTVAPPGPGEPAPDRRVSDAGGGTELPGRPVRAEGEPATGDQAADEAYDGLGRTWELFWSVFGRNSLDGAGEPLLGTVHYDRNYDNAFWDGTQMVFGDGDGEVFRRFTLAVDVIGHELTHGVTEDTARLVYQGQSGALSESVSDVFGSLVRQQVLGQDAGTADWLIGSDLFTDQVQGVALRSMRAPGTAYDDDVLGRDPQPATMAGYVETTDDNGGVHLNSGIPNHAFYLAATEIGGPAWERAGQVWYDVLTGSEITPDCDFATFAALTSAAARRRFGDSSAESVAVQHAWEQVGLPVRTPPASTDDAPADEVPTGTTPDQPAPDQPAPDQPAPDQPAPGRPEEPREPVPLGPAPSDPVRSPDPTPTEPWPPGPSEPVRTPDPGHTEPVADPDPPPIPGGRTGEDGGPDQGTGEASGDTTVELIRSGGVTGVVRRTTFVLSQLDPPDAEQWRGLLARPDFWSEVVGSSPEGGTAPVADDVSYRVLARRSQSGTTELDTTETGAELDTTVDERRLPDPVRALVRRTLGRDPA